MSRNARRRYAPETIFPGDNFKIIYIYKALRSLVSPVSSFVCPPGDKQFVCPPGTNISHTQLGGGEGQTICLSPGDKHFSHTAGGGDKQFVCPRGTNIFHTQ